ncbi:hypothetical protein [Sphingobium yanoikuyae]|uniref:hypothetical protein n=1 Tax=Sphingobium yanoikuyae TaxID=13690 RepID=UPI0035C7501E
MTDITELRSWLLCSASGDELRRNGYICTARLMDEFRALLDRLEAAERGWQPIETAPRDGTWFWALWPVHTVEDQQQATSWQPWHRSEEPRFCNSADSIDWCQPTHWRPLPDAPAIREVKP